jgi:DNA-binding PadR family transcriptional regulator
MSKLTTFKPPLSQPVFYVLLSLVSRERHGYGIIRGANDLSLGEMIIAPGTVYPLLARLTEAGLIKSLGYSVTANRDAPRKHYAHTTRTHPHQE